MLYGADSVQYALKNITTLFNNVVEHMDSVEDQLHQQNHRTPSSSSSEQKSTRKKSSIQVHIVGRKTYKMLIENMEDDFEGFNLDPRWIV